MLTSEQSLSVFYQMLRFRLIEEEIAKKYSEQEMRCPVHLSIGQEAAEIASAMALEPEDYVMSGHRAHGHYLGKGGSLKAMIAELYGKKTGCAGGYGGSMHLIDKKVGFLGSAPIVGSTIAIAAGVAMSSSLMDEKSVTMVYFGDGATETGVFHETLNFAKLKSLPIIFVCENNLYSVYSPLNVRQPEERNNRKIVEGHGMEYFNADGNDPDVVYELCKALIEDTRRGGGPKYVELQTYRWREHCGPNYDDDLGYRSALEIKHWRKNDPPRPLR